MFLPVLASLAAIAGFTAWGMRRAVDPTIKEDAERKKLAKLLTMPAGRLKLDEAEDGLVLARRFGNKNATLYFFRIKEALRKKRTRI